MTIQFWFRVAVTDFSKMPGLAPASMVFEFTQVSCGPTVHNVFCISSHSSMAASFTPPSQMSPPAGPLPLTARSRR